jgi:site-specific DNA recombinase
VASGTSTSSAGRHSRRAGCDLPYLPLEQVEEAVAAQWDREVLPAELLAALRQQLTTELRAYNASAEHEQRRLTERVAAIRRERYKWAEKAMEGVVPADIARERQQLLVEQLLAAESALSRLSLDQDSNEATLHAVLDLVHSCGRAYRLSEARGRTGAS